MQKVVLPKKVTFQDGEEQHQGIVVVEPCFPGYGTTLGNSIRRVLLSSLPGAAVVGVNIKGADHEFTTVEHVKEDVLEIVLNLKKLRMKIFSDEEEVIKLEIKHKGEGKILAKDIEKNSKVEIINEDLQIAEVTDKNAVVEMDIFVSKGYGYVAIENRPPMAEKEVGYIDIDSIFTPINAVRVNIENVRVGQMTDWEKLIIDIKTDGTIAYQDAFNNAVDILVDQFSFLQQKSKINDNEEDETDITEDSEQNKDSDDAQTEEQKDEKQTNDKE